MQMWEGKQPVFESTLRPTYRGISHLGLRPCSLWELCVRSMLTPLSSKTEFAHLHNTDLLGQMLLEQGLFCAVQDF